MAAPCRWFNSPQGCFNGDHCRFLHIVEDKAICRYFNTSAGCRYGAQCHYKHETPISFKQNTEQSQPETNQNTETNQPDAVDTVVTDFVDYESRYSRAECLVFGECRNNCECIPCDAIMIILAFYFSELNYVALVTSNTPGHQQLVYFNIHPFTECAVSPIDTIFNECDDDDRFQMCSPNDPYFRNLFKSQSKSNHIMVRINDTWDTYSQENLAYCIETKECLKVLSLEQVMETCLGIELVRVPSHGIFVIGGMQYEDHDDLEDSNTIYQLTSYWKRCAIMNTARSNHRAVAMEENIVIHGGEHGERSMEIFDIESNSIKNLASSKIGRASHGMHYTVDLDAIFIAGGENNGGLRSCEKYDVAKNVWMTMPDTFGRYGDYPFLDFSNHLLYVMSKHGDVEFLDVRTNKWIAHEQRWFNANKYQHIAAMFKL